MKNTRRAQCGGKQRHKSRGAAEAALRSLERLEPDAQKIYEVYPCPHRLGKEKTCHFHVGHRAIGNPKSKYAHKKKDD